MALEEKVRVAAPDGLVAQVDGVTGRRYTAKGGGMYEMHPRDAKALLAEGGFVPSIGGPTTRGGYACPSCGFRAVVRICSRCGERCETDAERRARVACPTCSGPIRETVGMVCQTCGTDYASAPHGPALPAPIGDTLEPDYERQAQEFMERFEASAPHGPGIVMEYEINTATGAVRETGPAREAPIETRHARAALAADAARRTIYRERLA